MIDWRSLLCLLAHKGDERDFINGEWFPKCSRCGDILPWAPHPFEPKLNNLCTCAICGRFAIDHDIESLIID